MATQQQTEQALAQQEPPIEAAFLAAVAATVAGASLVSLLGLSDEEIIEQISFTAGDLSETNETVRDAYKAGAQLEETGRKFDMTEQEVTDWLNDRARQFVERVNEQQAEAIRLIILNGRLTGRSPREIVQDILGRKTLTSRRQGGVVGRTDSQAQWLINAREELASGDPSKMNDYLNRKLRDRKFDRLVKRYIKRERRVNQADIDKIVSAYSQNLLRQRAKMIAQTQVHTAFEKGRRDAWEQAVRAGTVNPDDLRKKWRSERDKRVRLTHRALNGNSEPFDQPFVSPSGATLMYPGDPSAPASEVVNCRCNLLYSVSAA